MALFWYSFPVYQSAKSVGIEVYALHNFQSGGVDELLGSKRPPSSLLRDQYFSVPSKVLL